MKKRKTKKSKRVYFSFTNEELASLVNEIIKDYPDRVTLRQLYYRFVADEGLPNNKNSYEKFMDHMTTVRENGWVLWDKIVDSNRQLKKRGSWSNPGEFLQDVTHAYKRDLQQGQEFHLEVWCEKKVAISHITSKYDIGLMAGGGYQSGPTLYEASERYKDIGKPVKILYLGDFDPSGWDIQRDIEHRLRNTFGINVEMIRVLLLEEDIKKYNLSPDRVKNKDPRSPEYIEQYGPDTYELDALPPIVLAEKLEDSICDNIDMDIYEEQVEKETEDKAKIARLIKSLNRR